MVVRLQACGFVDCKTPRLRLPSDCSSWIYLFIQQIFICVSCVRHCGYKTVERFPKEQSRHDLDLTEQSRVKIQNVSRNGRSRRRGGTIEKSKQEREGVPRVWGGMSLKGFLRNAVSKLVLGPRKAIEGTTWILDVELWVNFSS